MAATEKQRHDLFTKIEETLGTKHAPTMTEPRPPVGWADVATRHDLDAQTERLGAQMATWLFSAVGIQTAVIGILLVLTH